MPISHLPIPDVEQMVSRPVVTSIVKDILVWTGQDPAKTLIIYPGESSQPFQSGSDISSGSLDTANPQFKGQNYIEVEVQEREDPTRLKSTPVFYPNERAVFMNEPLFTYVYPVKSYNEVTITLRYRMRDKNQARRWRDDIRARISQDRGERIHELHFSYGFPELYMNILKSIHELEEKQGGEGLSWEEWFLKYSKQRITQVTDRAGNNEAWMVAEKQIRAIGWFDWETPDDITKEDDPIGWLASFTYKLYFDKPISMGIQYPNVVHNQVIPIQYRKMEQDYDLDNRLIDGAAMTMNLREFESRWIRQIRPQQAQERIPYWDDFVSATAIPDTVAVLDTLSLIRPSDMKSIVDYKDLGDRNLEPILLDFIRSESPWITKPLQSVLNVSLYEDKDLMDATAVTFTDGALSASKDLDIKKTYHARLSLYTDWTKLSKETLERLRIKGKVVMMLLSYLGYANCAGNRNVFSTTDHLIDSKWIWDYFDQYNTTRIPNGTMKDIVALTGKPKENNQANRVRATVGTAFIITKRTLDNIGGDSSVLFPQEDWWAAIHWPEEPPALVNAPAKTTP